jgi:hypothetical protein
MIDADANRPVSDFDACPDCVAEHSIKQHDLRILRNSNVTTVMRTGDIQHMPARSEGQAPPRRDNSLTRNLPAAREIASQAASDPKNRDQLMFSSDLGDDLEAVVFEREGRLERLITNSRSGRPTMILISRLAQELRCVSEAIAAQKDESLQAGIPDDVSTLSKSSGSCHRPFFEFDNFPSWTMAHDNDAPQARNHTSDHNSPDAAIPSRRWHDLDQRSDSEDDSLKYQARGLSPASDCIIVEQRDHTMSDDAGMGLTIAEKKLLQEYGLLESLPQFHSRPTDRTYDQIPAPPTSPLTSTTHNIDEHNLTGTAPPASSIDAPPADTAIPRPSPEAHLPEPTSSNTQIAPTPSDGPPVPSSQQPIPESGTQLTLATTEVPPPTKRPTRSSITRADHEVIRNAIRMQRSFATMPAIGAIRTAAAKERTERRRRLASHRIS